MMQSKEDHLQLINGYLNGTLSHAEKLNLEYLLQDDPGFADAFSRACKFELLLEKQFVESAAAREFDSPTSLQRSVPFGSRRWAMMALASAAAVFCLAVLSPWNRNGSSTAYAATAELHRIIETCLKTNDQSYHLRVLEAPIAKRSEKKRTRPEDRRPPKPSLDEAVLHVRDGRQFVLIRKMPLGEVFVTGSNGVHSWAVRPAGPVRVSSDLTRFSHDLPGHEHSFPLLNIAEGLHELEQAYALNISTEKNNGIVDDSEQWIVATQRSTGHKGPKRVEIKYNIARGQISCLRFIEMPYGPDRIPVLELECVQTQNLPQDFFDHTSHHAPDRSVEIE